MKARILIVVLALAGLACGVLIEGRIDVGRRPPTAVTAPPTTP